MEVFLHVHLSIKMILKIIYLIMYLKISTGKCLLFPVGHTKAFLALFPQALLDGKLCGLFAERPLGGGLRLVLLYPYLGEPERNCS